MVVVALVVVVVRRLYGGRKGIKGGMYRREKEEREGRSNK